MSDDATTFAHAEAVTAAERVPALLERLSERIGASSGASAVFGEPVEQAGRTVIPVAQSIIGTGGGGGEGEAGAGSGIGAGAGAVTRPLGYIELTSSGATFVPLKRPWQDPGLVLAYAVIVLMVSRALVRLVRG